MDYLFLTISFLIIQIFLLSFFKKKKIFFDEDFKKPQSVHKISIPRIGGVILFFPLLLIFYYLRDTTEIQGYFVVCSVCFFLGMLDDVKIVNNPILRFIFLISSFIFSAIFFEIKITSFGDEYLNNLNNYYIFSIILVTSCLFAATNGANLTDGFNGLMLLNILISFLLFFVPAYLEKNYFIIKLLILTFPLLLFLLFINFPKAKIFMGDSGAYLCGSLIGMIAISLNKNWDISPFYLAYILIYFVFELFFSICRKLIERKNPFKPDNMHLHLLLFQFLKQQKINGANYKTSLIINVINFFLITPSIFFYKNILITKIFFFIYMIIYICCYFILKKKLFNNFFKI
jgi:UDP-N-acetylmuramyl pentapeptide phosphotransferase/UDP-N-acetylglucosamine-1-phosphate transferase